MCCFKVQKKQHGDVVALLSDDGREVEILEILMQALLAHWLAFMTAASEKVYTPPSTSDPFSNFKLPVMACAVVLLLGRLGGGGSRLMQNGKRQACVCLKAISS